MQIQESVDRLIAKYGSLVELPGEPPVTASALIQPLRRRDRSFFGGEYTKPGLMQTARFLYIGPGSHPLTGLRNQTLRQGGQSYRILQAQEVQAAGKPVYCWGILALQEESPDES